MLAPTAKLRLNEFLTNQDELIIFLASPFDQTVRTSSKTFRPRVCLDLYTMYLRKYYNTLQYCKYKNNPEFYSKVVDFCQAPLMNKQ